MELRLVSSDKDHATKPVNVLSDSYNLQFLRTRRRRRQEQLFAFVGAKPC